MSKQRRTVLSGIVTPFPTVQAAEPPSNAAAAPIAEPVTAPSPAKAPAAPRAANKPAPSKATKEATVQQTLYLPPAVHDQLRELAFSERVKMHALVMEGLDAVFKKRGMKPIATLLKS